MYVLLVPYNTNFPLSIFLEKIHLNLFEVRKVYILLCFTTQKESQKTLDFHKVKVHIKDTTTVSASDG